jgi:hypothetical protein
MFFALGSCVERIPAFAFKENSQGLTLFEAEKPVFSYQREPLSLDGKYVCNNYIHPLYSIDGDTLTEEFPSSHPYHRGIFWAWHYVFIEDQRIGSTWTMENISHDVAGLKTSVQGRIARLDLDVYWKSTSMGNGSPFIHETTSVMVHEIEDEIRKIDFEISLKALVPGVGIAGADNEFGYGGFCLRIKTPADMVFTSENGQVIHKRGETWIRPWMDFYGSFGHNKEESGLTLICHPDTPGYPPAWILNPLSSMQNPAFPGRYRTELPVHIPVVLKYRLIVHTDNVRIQEDFARLKAEYDQFSFTDN